LGSFERFMGVIIEHFNGNFPLWLAPEQVRILPVSDDNIEYAKSVADELNEFRTEIETRSWTVGRKIREAHDDRVPYMLIVGDTEEEAGTVSVRDREEREQDGVEIGEFHSHLQTERDEKTVEPAFLG
ncbi:MAG TPA: His/Gly/Thr/Pro-type tRNA ligase C-terminal domain-containing protein, partial [Halococcus sp.]|nr:His/Gly/Thr/Pro-type tRNA ligase C-terminal domain-containing protein [Halococcus sp.]